MQDSQGLVDYFLEFMPTAKVECKGCGLERELSKAVTRENNFYCSTSCADRSCATYIKPQPKGGVKLDGWDI